MPGSWMGHENGLLPHYSAAQEILRAEELQEALMSLTLCVGDVFRGKKIQEFLDSGNWSKRTIFEARDKDLEIRHMDDSMGTGTKCRSL